METDVRPNLGEDGTLVIRARGGEARGYPDGGVFAWKGMPYAAAPVGERRFRAPQPAQPWDGVRDCREFGPIAPQGQSPAVRSIGPSKSTRTACRSTSGPRDPTARRDR